MGIIDRMLALDTWECTAIAEALFSLDCLKNDMVREAILELEGDEAEMEVEGYTYEEIYSRYTEYMNQMGDPIDIAEFLADKREREYECQEINDDAGSWESYERARSEHALELLAQFERRYR